MEEDDKPRLLHKVKNRLREHLKIITGESEEKECLRLCKGTQGWFCEMAELMEELSPGDHHMVLLRECHDLVDDWYTATRVFKSLDRWWGNTWRPVFPPSTRSMLT